MPNLRMIVLAIGMALIAAVGLQTWRLHLAQKDLVAEQKAYATFKGGVATLGEEAKRRAAVQAATDSRNKERTDEENRKRAATSAALVRGLRAESDATRGRFLSALGAATRSADEAEKFRAKFERAYRALVQDVRGVGDDGDAAVIDLDSAKDWASRVRP